MILNRSQECKAYLTVYLSLSLSIILTLIMTLLGGARIGAVKMKTELVTDIAMNSVLGEYNIALFEKYGLLFVDTSYGEGQGSIVNVNEHLRKYFSKNFELSPLGKTMRRTTMTKTTLEDVSVTGYSLATDGNASVLKRQIAAYMEADFVGEAIKEVRKNADALKVSGYDEMDIEKEASKAEADADGTYFEDADGDGEAEEYSIDNPAANVTSQKSLGILTLSAPDIGELSSKAINSENLISHRKIKHGTGLDEEFSSKFGDKLIFDEYIFEKCGYYGNENVDSPLGYELEYIFAGKESDYKNLEAVVNRLFLIREASNYIHIMSDSRKIEEARALALTASAIMAVPELEEVLKTAIIFAWTFAETISDLRLLLTGGKVPLIKTNASWNLSIENMLDFRNNLKNGGGSGLSYEDYLKILILTKNEKDKTVRMMDVIEMNVRQTDGNSRFKLDNCLDVFRAKFTVKGFFSQNIIIERIYGYEM